VARRPQRGGGLPPRREGDIETIGTSADRVAARWGQRSVSRRAWHHVTRQR
jgi:hypothetical protein